MAALAAPCPKNLPFAEGVERVHDAGIGYENLMARGLYGCYEIDAAQVSHCGASSFCL
jgi:hypothetical protein